MSATFVLDCSLSATWLFHDQATTQGTDLLRQLETETALVPTLWFLELTNVIAAAERKGRLREIEASEFIDLLSKLNFDVDADNMAERAFDRLLPLCRAHRLTSYDAVYLELAIRRRLPLATLDEQLRKVARNMGVKLLGK